MGLYTKVITDIQKADFDSHQSSLSRCNRMCSITFRVPSARIFGTVSDDNIPERIHRRRELVPRHSTLHHFLPVPSNQQTRNSSLLGANVPHLTPHFHSDLAHPVPDIPSSANTDDGGHSPNDIRNDVAVFCRGGVARENNAD
jgi:hypothetical protein